jgi:hypothetical protein
LFEKLWFIILQMEKEKGIPLITDEHSINILNFCSQRIQDLRRKNRLCGECEL